MNIFEESNGRRLAKLMAALVEGVLDAEQRAELERLLAGSEEARRFYVRYMDQHMALEEGLAAPALSAKASAPSVSRAAFHAVAAALVITLVGLALAGMLLLKGKAQVDGGLLALQETVAIVTRADDTQLEDGSSLNRGRALQPGVIELAEGRAQINFFSGATVLLEAPVIFELVNPNKGYLHRGKAAAKVPEQAFGFTISTPGTAVVDLGTEFALDVAEDGTNTVHVYDGKVEASLLGLDGFTLRSESVSQDQSLAISPLLSSVEYVKGLEPDLPRVLPPDHSALLVSNDYVQAVKASKPVLYWRFEGEDGRNIANEMGDRYAAAMVGPVALEGNSVNHCARFPEVDDNLFLQSSEPVEALNADTYAIEMWIKPDSYHWSTLAALYQDPPADAPEGTRPRHLCVIETMHESTVIHPLHSIRFLHRWPAESNGGINIFSPGAYSVGEWQHLVAVKEGAALSLFLNGERVAQVEKGEDSDAEAYHFVVGQLDALRGARQFVGQLDEVALYDRALDASEIKRHYQLVSRHF